MSNLVEDICLPLDSFSTHPYSNLRMVVVFPDTIYKDKKRDTGFL